MIYHSHPLEGTGVRVYLSSSSSRNNLLAAKEELSTSIDDFSEPHSSFDTVHPLDECRDCHAYTKHVDQTFRSAPMHSKDGTFKDGIALGRRLQLEDDSIHFSRYRGRLQMARKQQEELHASQHRYRERTESLEAEIGVLRDRFMAMQMAYDDIVGRVDGAPPSQWASEFFSFEPKSHVNSPASSTASFEHAGNASNTWPDDDAVMVRREEVGFGFSDDGDDEDDFLLAQQLRFIDGRERREEGQFWAGLSNGNVSDGESDGYNAATSSSSSSLISNSDSDTPPSEESDTSLHQELLSAPLLETELSIDELSTLINAAQENGNTEALGDVRLLVQDAQRTPRKKRTAGQLYLLLTWRTPSWVSGSPRAEAPTRLGPTSLSLPSTSTSLPTQPEVFVDASSYGVGLVFGQRWLAWRFAQGHPAIPVGPDGIIIMSWAELIAVELGVMTLIEAGYHDARVVIRSDNLGVVNALREGRWKPHYDLDGILKRIVRLCQKSKLDLVVRWVSTKVNPADKPSRGVFPPAALALSHAPVLPVHLMGFLTQVSAI